MDADDWLTGQFEQHRPRLYRLCYRMLGSPAEADDALQDAWVRLSGAGPDDVDNPGGWLTTVVARVCLNRLRSRAARPEDPAGMRLPDPVVSRDVPTPADEAVRADSVSLALLVVLDTLGPAERLAFVLHDVFDLPFEQIAGLVDRSPAAARQLASRARRRVRGAKVPDAASDRRRSAAGGPGVLRRRQERGPGRARRRARPRGGAPRGRRRLPARGVGAAARGGRGRPARGAVQPAGRVGPPRCWSTELSAPSSAATGSRFRSWGSRSPAGG